MAQAYVGGVIGMVDNSDDNRKARGGQKRNSGQRGEFQDAVDRLERAVQDLVGSATNEFSDRATSFVDEITAKMEREFPGRGDQSADERGQRRRSNAAARMRARRQARRESSWGRLTERTSRLYRDPRHAKIGGVCAGIANYYGVEPWVVRCVAVTGMLFLPQIIFPAYWIAYFVMDKPPRDKDKRPSRAKSANDYAPSPTPELGPTLSPRQSLRTVQADLSQTELRLRRMEAHVTSGRYELQRELNRIDVDPPTKESGSGSPA
jgi:phage shock protein C